MIKTSLKYTFIATVLSLVPSTAIAHDHSKTVIDVDVAATEQPSFTSFNNTTPKGFKWEKVNRLSDDFNQGWDATKWKKSNWNYSDTPVNMLNKNSDVSEGYLWIKATLNDNSEKQWFETSRVHSKMQIKFPMYTESRVKVADIAAYTTFWLNNGNAKNRDEIDIIELNPRPVCGKEPNYPWQMNSQYFIVKDGVTERAKGPWSTKKLSDANTQKGQTWAEDFHVFGMWWKDEHNVQFYLNGEPAGKVKTIQPFTRDQELIWDLWTQDSPWVCGLPEKSDLLDDTRNTMKVDWVRTWRLVAE